MFENNRESQIRALKKILDTHLWAKLLIALALGVGAGFLLSHSSDYLSEKNIKLLAEWIALPGSLYLTLIQMVIVPLILSSLILSLTNIAKLTQARSVALSSLFFITISTLVSIFLGILIVNVFKPGVAIQDAAMAFGKIEIPERGAGLFSFTPDSILNLIPVNPLATLVKGDLLDVLILALIFGLVISRMERSKVATIVDFLEGTQALCMQLITWTIKLAPYAVFGLMVRSVVSSGSSVLVGMFGYLLCVFIGFFLIILCWLVWLSIIGVNPVDFIKKIKEPLLLAFSLSSSAATMPTTIKTAKNELNIPSELADFLIPIGVAINMAGSALWQSSATFFLAQAFGGDIDFSVTITVVILTIGATIGAPGIPGAGVGVLNTTLKSVGVPASGIPLILGVDRLVDMGCTVINVMGDLVMCKTTLWFVNRKKSSH